MKFLVREYNSNAKNDILGQVQIEIPGDINNFDGQIDQEIVRHMDAHYKTSGSKILCSHEESCGGPHVEPGYTVYIIGRDKNDFIFTLIAEMTDNPVETRSEIIAKYQAAEVMIQEMKKEIWKISTHNRIS